MHDDYLSAPSSHDCTTRQEPATRVTFTPYVQQCQIKQHDNWPEQAHGLSLIHI